MERWRNRVALITGASYGIGKCIALYLAKEGMTVVGCARSEDKLQLVKDEALGYAGKFFYYICDLKNISAVRKMFSDVVNQHGSVDVCVVNAGILKTSMLMDGKCDDWQDMFQVNVIAASLCAQLAFASMREKGINDGHVIFINSMAGHRVPPGGFTNMYSATKFALTAVAEGFRAELRASGSTLRVSSISPAMTDTPLAQSLVGLFRDMQDLKILDPEDIASALCYILSAPLHVEINNILMRPTIQSS